MVCASREMAVYCFDVLLAHLKKEAPPSTTSFVDYCRLFVTWKKVIKGSNELFLRGCIGILEKQRLNTGLEDCAISSAMDSRFGSIVAEEVPYLQCTVSILTHFEPAKDYLDWEIGVHGLKIEFDNPGKKNSFCATYLPEIPLNAGWTKEYTIDSLVRKASYCGVIDEALRKSITLSRYKTTVFTLKYSEYAADVTKIKGMAPSVNGRASYGSLISC